MKTWERIKLEDELEQIKNDTYLMNTVDWYINQEWISQIKRLLDNDEDYIPFNPNQLKLFV